MYVFIPVLAIVLLAAILYLLERVFRPKPLTTTGAHVMITGGSSGIGLALAVEAVKNGASVSLLARNQDRLDEAKKIVEQAVVDSSTQKVMILSVDLSSDYELVENAIRTAEASLGPVDMLVNSAGFSICGQFEDIPVNDFKRLLDVNYIGGVMATRAVLRGMKERRRGRVVFVSSQAGQMGIFGFTGYCASKFALRGLAEALQMEVKPYNIRVTLSFPPDTDTPGYEEEMKTKPEETRLISETSGLLQPDVVARAIMHDMIAGRFLSSVGFDGWLLATVTCGASPFCSFFETTYQILLMGLFKLISVFVLLRFDRIVERCRVKRLAASSSPPAKNKKQG